MNPPEVGRQESVVDQARRRAEVTRRNVEAVLLLAQQQGGPYDFLSLAAAAHCSVTYLRNHSEFAARIRELQATVPSAPIDAREVAWRRRLRRAERRAGELGTRVAQLESENAQLRRLLAMARAPGACGSPSPAVRPYDGRARAPQVPGLRASVSPRSTRRG